jgi:hypothetical protein
MCCCTWGGALWDQVGGVAMGPAVGSNGDGVGGGSDVGAATTGCGAEAAIDCGPAPIRAAPHS